MELKSNSRVMAMIFMGFFLFIVLGNLMLASFFEFPDILRDPPEQRFALFNANHGPIAFSYYLMGLTSLMQVFMAVGMYHLTRKGRLLDLFALTSGVLSGIFQMIGFFRWVILIPMLSNAYESNAIDSETIFFLEKFANTYFGMTVGEHLGTLFTGIWLSILCFNLVKSSHFDRKLSWLGFISGIALIVQSYEAVAADTLKFLADLAIVIWALYVIWVMIMAVMLWRGSNEEQRSVPLGLWIIALIVYIVNVIPSLL